MKKTSFTKTLLLNAVIIIIVAACGSNMQTESTINSDANSLENNYSDDSKTTNANTSNQKLIKTGTLRFETTNGKETRLHIVQATGKFNGYTSVDNISTNNGFSEFQLSVHIPAKKFDEFIQHLNKQIDNITHQSINIEDITEKYLDIETRLKSKKTLSERYHNLLKQAKTVDEMLTIEKELEKVTADLESMQAQIKLFDTNIAFSSLNIYFTQIKSPENTLATEIKQALAGGWSILIEILFGILSIWPLILIIAITVWLIIRFDKKKKQEQKTNKNTPINV